ncbi:uncharacterized protein LOC129310686 [Prosopis cineraria]|uniref:uncharacterized protein LOC129310686 n=1 Tax=Prosopis cineraria TaxID=364024 RepID=UPI0024103585|nr:uncharacterized protein LOC129310686 [Prosopis cineraria]XP_054808578.1 uncharacterized protein LOC129310686 [Prosopis cineraria]
MSSSESCDGESTEMVMISVENNPFKETKEGGAESELKLLLPSDSSNSIPSFPYDSPLSEPAPSSPTTQNHQVHIQSPEPSPQSAEAYPTHPVLEIIESQDLVKVMLGLLVPILTGLITASSLDSHNTIAIYLGVVSLCLAFAFIFNGIVLRNTHCLFLPLYIHVSFCFCQRHQQHQEEQGEYSGPQRDRS